MSNRYDTDANPDGQYQPGSGRKILLNKLDITDPDEADNLEFDLLADLQDELLNEIELDTRISVDELCRWHARWLGRLYDWAGSYRTVNLSKDDYTFAAADQVPRLMAEYDKNYLHRYTPCERMRDDELVEALAVCHVEFIIIHPFREGNGRLARLLATVMALQADKPPLDFETMHRDKAGYIAAIQAGHACDYSPMQEVFERILA